MRKCGQRGGLTVRLEGFLRHPPPWSRGGPLFRHPTARGGPTAHPLPGACVSTSERPDTGAVVSVRWKWRLQSGRALSSLGPLPPPSAMEAPEVLWQRRGETDGGNHLWHPLATYLISPAQSTPQGAHRLAALVPVPFASHLLQQA